MMIEKCVDMGLDILESYDNVQIMQEIDIKLITFVESNEEKEKTSNKWYSQEAERKKQQICLKYDGYNESDDERDYVRQPIKQSAGCVKEVIKEEEIDAGIGRRYCESQTKPE